LEEALFRHPEEKALFRRPEEKALFRRSEKKALFRPSEYGKMPSMNFIKSTPSRNPVSVVSPRYTELDSVDELTVHPPTAREIAKARADAFPVPENPLVSILTPFYNEEAVIWPFYRSITKLIDTYTKERFEVLCVDDGSCDNTLARLQEIAAIDRRFRVIELSRNFGKEAALTAAIDMALGDAVIPMDADLQDPPDLIATMISEWRAGADVVLAKRCDRSVDSFLKRQTATWFYKLHNRISSIRIPENVGDFRLMNRAVVDALRQLPEQHRFMKGLFAWVGFRTKVIEYNRQDRVAGKTKFSGWSLWNFALDGITSFSTILLRLWAYIGFGIAMATLSYALFIVIRTVINGVDVPGYASLLVAVLFIGSLQLISIGILGEYIGRMYLESKNRPNYVIRKIYESATEGREKVPRDVNSARVAL
jgi:polyisoprenyl-phosphate glycosyltransferase